MPFRDRRDAGQQLAARLGHLAESGGAERAAVVVGLPRGGVPVAAQVSAALRLPLDVIVVRKLGVPSQPELAMGAIGEGGARVMNEAVVRAARVTDDEISAVEQRERTELERRVRRFRGDRARIPFEGRTVIVVDDGIATGSTARAALEVARQQGAARVVLAVPVAPPETVAALESVADEVVAVETPAHLYAIGAWYDDFAQTSDDEVVTLLATAHRDEDMEHGDERSASDAEVIVAAGSARLGGHLTVPRSATGLVIFAHGSGSGRFSERNRYVARELNAAGLATLLFDLLTEEEGRDRANVFDIPLLAGRLTAALEWTADQPSCRGLPIGYFGASTGAGAALLSAASTPGVSAVVSRGGRPDLAGDSLPLVTAPTLLIVGGNDDVVIDLNNEAAAQLQCHHATEIVPGASHLFEEPGTLEAVADLARDWFLHHLAGVTAPNLRQ